MANDKNVPGAVLDSVMETAKGVGHDLIGKADSYLNGTYKPSEEARKVLVKGTTTALVVLSLITGLAFSGPAEINEEQVGAQLNQAPIVLDIDDYVNTSPDDDSDDADEQRGSKSGPAARFKQAVMKLPAAARLLIVTPLWIIGTALMTLVSFLWNVIFSSPLGAFIASFAVGFAVLFGLFAATAKILFPDVPLRRMLSGRNVLVLGIAAVLLAVIDWLAPMFWHQYPLASAGVKLTIGALVIGTLSYKIKRTLHLGSIRNMPDPAA